MSELNRRLTNDEILGLDEDITKIATDAIASGANTIIDNTVLVAQLGIADKSFAALVEMDYSGRYAEKYAIAYADSDVKNETGVVKAIMINRDGTEREHGINLTHYTRQEDGTGQTIELEVNMSGSLNGKLNGERIEGTDVALSAAWSIVNAVRYASNADQVRRQRAHQAAVAKSTEQRAELDAIFK